MRLLCKNFRLRAFRRVEIVLSKSVLGTFADMDGKSRNEQVEAKLSRRGRKILNEGEEIRSPKRNVIRWNPKQHRTM